MGPVPDAQQAYEHPELLECETPPQQLATPRREAVRGVETVAAAITIGVITALEAALWLVLFVAAVAPGGQACDVPVINVIETTRTSISTAASIARQVFRCALHPALFDWPNMAQRPYKSFKHDFR